MNATATGQAAANRKGHQCTVEHVHANGTDKCPFAAFKKDGNDQWLCRKHLRMARERANTR